MGEWKKKLPAVRGTYRFDAPLAKTNWFRVGGPAEVLFKPEDTDDLAHFMKHKPPGVAVTVIGVGSNLIVRDGGIAGVVIRLGRGFNHAVLEGEAMVAGASLMDVNLAQIAASHQRAGLEFFAGIPGTVGGALAMNAGAYGSETGNVLLQAEAVTPDGKVLLLPLSDLHYSYRHCGAPEGMIFTRGWFATVGGEASAIEARIRHIQKSREATQPIRERTGGSTFKNPSGKKAWELIDAAGCRGLAVGDARVSELHCNFMINAGEAPARDLEALGEQVRARVLAHSGVQLEWEIKRIGAAA